MKGFTEWHDNPPVSAERPFFVRTALFFNALKCYDLMEGYSMRKFFAFSAMALLLALHSNALADEAVRSAQVILKTAGYYSGEATGELSADTKAALRRYQIRNELEPTGELTPETVAALNQEGAPESAPAPTAPVPPPVATPTPYSRPLPPPPAACRAGNRP